jgi:hypothetical protein
MSIFFELLQQYKVRSPLIRLGRQGDGGYVLPQVLIDEAEVFYGYGVGSDISFELDFLERKKISIKLFDHTVDSLPGNLRSSQITFIKEGLSAVKSDHKNTFSAHKKKFGDEGSKIILKVDIEGSEYECFNETFFGDCSNVVGLILELHDIGRNKQLASTLLGNLNKDFYLVYMHGNNYGRLFLDGEFIFPDTAELVFLRKKIADGLLGLKAEFNSIPFLDFPCNSSVLDFPNALFIDRAGVDEIINIYNSLSDAHLAALLENGFNQKAAQNHILSLNTKLKEAETAIKDCQSERVNLVSDLEVVNTKLKEAKISIKKIESLYEKITIVELIQNRIKKFRMRRKVNE